MLRLINKGVERKARAGYREIRHTFGITPIVSIVFRLSFKITSGFYKIICRNKNYSLKHLKSKHLPFGNENLFLFPKFHIPVILTLIQYCFRLKYTIRDF